MLRAVRRLRSNESEEKGETGHPLLRLSAGASAVCTEALRRIIECFGLEGTFGLTPPADGK